MTITSPKFNTGELIPSLYTCDGNNINPPLIFSDIPTEAKSLALIMFDPDVPKQFKPDGNFDHWLIWNLAPTTTELKEDSTPAGIQGANSAGRANFTGPCPPDAEHRYFFRLYALDVMLNLPAGSNRIELEQAMQNHILAQAELMGRYQRI